MSDPTLPPPGFTPPNPGSGPFAPPGVGQPPPGGGPSFAPPAPGGGPGGPGGPGGSGMVPVQPTPPGRPWWKGPAGIAVAAAAVVAVVVAIVVVATSGGDTKQTDRTDRTEVTAPGRTDDDTTRPRRTTDADTAPRFSIPPLTDPPRPSTTGSTDTTGSTHSTDTTGSTGSTETTDGTSAPVTTAAPPAGAASPIGATVTSGADHLAVTVVDLVDDAPAGQFLEPDPGNKLVAVRLHVANTGATAVTSFLVYDAKLIDTAGQQFSQGFVAAAVGPELLTVSLSGSDARSGWVTYEVPEATVPQRFQTDLGDTLAVWDLTAPRQDPVGLAPPAPADVPLGSAATLTGSDDVPFELTVNQVVDNAEPSFGSADPGNRYVAVQVTYHNTGNAALDEFPEVSLQIVDTEGQSWRPSFGGTTAGPGFDGEVKLVAGDSRTGFVTFELAQAATPLKLVSASFGVTDDSVSLALA